MSEQEKSGSSFMRQLDDWTEINVITPLAEAFSSEQWEEALPEVKASIRKKVYESFRNGQASGGGQAPASLPTARRYPVPMRPRVRA
jgi:hypothetical protein